MIFPKNNITEGSHRFQPRSGVTIFIPNWNHEYLLPRSIGSALRAARQLREHNVPAEVLVIDDGSRDGSVTLLRQLEALYFEDGLRVMLLPENIGPVAVRELGLHHAMYQYITWLDADNELLPENQYHFYRALVQTQAAVVYGNLFYIEQDSTQVQLISNEGFQDKMLESNYIDNLSMVDRFQILDTGGFLDKRIATTTEDWEMYLHLAANGRKIVFVPLVAGTFYVVPGSRHTPYNEDEAYRSYKQYNTRVYDQLGMRQDHLLNTRYLRYHPDLGYI